MADDLQAEIRRYQDAISTFPEDNYRIRAGLFKAVGQMYLELYEKEKSLNRLDEAIRNHEAAVSASKGEGGPAPVDHLQNLTKALHIRYDQTHSVADLDMSIQTRREIVRLCPDVRLFGALGQRIRDRYLRTGSVDHLKEAVELLGRVAKNTPTNFPELRAVYSYHLALGLRDLNYETGSSENLDDAIRMFQSAKDTPSPDSSRARYSSGLALGLLDRYVERGSEIDLQKAIDIQRNVVESIAENDEEKAGRLGTLGNAYYYQYRRTGVNTDLHQAMSFQKRAIATTPVQSLYKAQRLNSLAVTLREQYLRTGSMKNSEEALKSAKAVFETASIDHPIRTVCIHNIGLLFFDRYLLTRSMEDLQNAIQSIEKALRESPMDHPKTLERWSSLGAIVRERFKRTGSVNDYEAALSVGENAKTKTPTDHLNYPMCLSNLAGVYHDRYIWEPTDIEALEKAILLRRLAVDKTPEEHRDRAQWMSNLARVLRYRFKEKDSEEDLKEAIYLGQTAVNLTPEDHPELASRLNDLGVFLQVRYDATESQDDLRQALDCFAKSLRQGNGTPFKRVKSGRRAAYFAIHQGKWKEAALYLAECIDLLPRVVLRSNSNSDHQSNLEQLSNLGPLTASIFLNAGKSALESLQALEKARGIISSLIMDSRSDVSLLKEGHPELCAEYQGLREVVASSLFGDASSSFTSMSLPPENYASISLRRSEYVTKLGEIEEKIRTLPGFQTFHLAPTEEELCGLAVDGPVVSYNITEAGSHAFLISKNTVEVLTLPRISLDDIEGYIEKMPAGDRALRNGYIVSDSGSKDGGTGDLDGPLRSLWDLAVEPVLERLELLSIKKSSDSLPCVWWVGGGIMAILPLHAAGDQRRDSSANTVSHVISSYAPTFKALRFARNKAWSPPKAENDKILVIAMPETPEHPRGNLNIDPEIAAIRQHVGSSASVEILRRPNRQQVLQQITTCSLVHFACHGSADFLDPSDSALWLGAEKLERLTVNDLRPLNHKLAQLAYLSACSTAENGARSLIDESIHLASTFQLLGFRHVIGTLWGADDSAAVAVAASFYERLLQRPEPPSAVARALHHAAMDRRARNDSFDWVPFIHVGP